MDSNDLNGTLIAALGDTIAEVNARSTYHLNTEILKDEDLSAADRPVQFNYGGPHGVVLPPTRTVGIDSVATVIYGIESAPQLEYADIDTALALADRLSPTIRAAGWVLDPAAPNLTGRHELAIRLADPTLPEATAWHLAVYRQESAELTFRLQRLRRPQPGFPKGAFLLNLIWWDDVLRKKAEAIADRLRHDDGVISEWPRPIEAKSYSKRVRQLMPY